MAWDPDAALPPDATVAERLAAHYIVELQRSTEQREVVHATLQRVEALLVRIDAQTPPDSVWRSLGQCIHDGLSSDRGAVVASAIAQAIAWAIAASVAYASGMLHLPPPPGLQ